jgi:putative cell wall-binding protein
VPVLLTRKSCLPQHVADEIATLDPSQVYVIGGTNAVSYSLDDAPPICG